MNNLYQINEKNIKKAKKVIESGGLISLPTETVYGLCADATNESAVKKIFCIKNRPLDNPLNVLLYDKKEIKKYANIESEIEKSLIKYFMPGPITIILKNKYVLPKIINHTGNLGIRIPDLESTIDICKSIKKPLVAPSANITGKKSPINPYEVYDYFQEDVSMIFDGGECKNKISSTICEVVGGKIKIRRQGPITKQDILNKVGNVDFVD